MRFTLLLMLGSLLLVSGCQPATKISRSLKNPARTEQEQEKYERAVKKGAVLIGMTKSEVRQSRGDPQRKDYVRRFGGARVRRWMYPWDEVYFDDSGLVVGTHAAYR